MAGAEGVEKLEDVIVRSAEQVPDKSRGEGCDLHRHLRPGPGVENTLVTILSRSRASDRVPGSPRPSWSKRWASRSGSMPSASSSP